MDDGYLGCDCHSPPPTSIIIIFILAITALSTAKDIELFTFPWFNTPISMFSIKNAFNSYLDTSQLRSSKLNGVNGVRVLILVWIIAVHTFVQVDYQYFREMQTLKSLASKWISQLFTNSLFQFDCLLLISAFLFGFYNIQNTSLQCIKYVLIRYIK